MLVDKIIRTKKFLNFIVIFFTNILCRVKFTLVILLYRGMSK